MGHFTKAFMVIRIVLNGIIEDAGFKELWKLSKSTLESYC